MDKNQINEIVISTIKNYCEENEIQAELTKDTPLIGSARILDSMGLVNCIVDIETAFLDEDVEISLVDDESTDRCPKICDEDVEISLTSEAAMSGRISPFRSVGSLCNFIARQLGIEEE